MPRRFHWRLPLFVSGIFLMSQAYPLPSPVRDAATFAWTSGFHLHLPFWHIVFTPFCSVADYLTALSVHQTKFFCAYLIVLFFLMFKPRRALLAVALFIVYVAWGALIPRPMGRLTADDPDILLIDFHSHTQYSHDGRPSFTPEANMDWHRLQGYNAAFITDHNLVDAAEIAKADSTKNWKVTGYRSLEGEEVSLSKTHLVILGNRYKIDNRPYDTNPRRIEDFVADMRKINIPVIASLPEYWFYHWQERADGGGDIHDFVRWGMAGFEIINSAPKALDFPPAYRVQIVDLCRTHNLFMTGISDNHGYGYATDAWNALRLPGWQSLGPDDLEKAVIHDLKTRGFLAVQVLERVKYFPANSFQLALSPFANVWVYWRSLQLAQVLAWIAWIWLFALLKAF